MPRIESIEISGFRGVACPGLELQFGRDEPTSMVLYGGNGTGKSSITDAWEWLWSGNIEHLRREGAGPASFPHRRARDGETYVRVKLEGSRDAVGLRFRQDRVATPVIEGDLQGLRASTPHPCHLRHRALVDFMYLTKSQKYEALSRLMGFERAVGTQQGLGRAERLIAEKRESLEERLSSAQAVFVEYGIDAPGTEDEYLTVVGSALARQGLEAVSAASEIASRLERLRGMVVEHPAAVELAMCRAAKQVADRLAQLTDLHADIEALCASLGSLAERERCADDLLCLELYRAGEGVLSARQEADICPLCDQPYDGDLCTHVRQKRVALQEVEETRQQAEERREDLVEKLRRQQVRLEDAESEMDREECVREILGEIGERLGNALRWVEEWYAFARRDLASIVNEVRPPVGSADYRMARDSAGEVAERLTRRILELESDEGRRRLVEDFEFVRRTAEGWRRVDEACRMLDQVTRIQAQFRSLVERFNEAVQQQVLAEFDEVSDDVAGCFGTLERQSEVLGAPSIGLATTADRAVVLSVGFGGDVVTPAYTVLSESQLASFGLAVFLCCARRFNPEIPFVILDDVIGSFDAYKRDAVIDVLRYDCANVQFLVLTHDRVWFERLQRAFPRWSRLMIGQWDLNTGPRVDTARSAMERIRHAAAEDEGEIAGALLGPYLEQQLQELCEAAEAELKYNRRNEFTLSDLFVAFRKRMSKKLGSEHAVVQYISASEEDLTFRNFCAHWKDPPSPYLAVEIGEIVEQWRQIESAMTCGQCGRYVQWDGTRDMFVCRCGSRELCRE